MPRVRFFAQQAQSPRQFVYWFRQTGADWPEARQALYAVLQAEKQALQLPVADVPKDRPQPSTKAAVAAQRNHFDVIVSSS